MEHHESFFAEPRNWVVLAFILFFVLFGRILWRALSGMLDNRAKMVKAELEESARLRREAEAMLQPSVRLHTAFDYAILRGCHQDASVSVAALAL